MKSALYPAFITQKEKKYGSLGIPVMEGKVWGFGRGKSGLKSFVTSWIKC
jgi:hypothetical protein